jgi:hypothetical protein
MNETIRGIPSIDGSGGSFPVLFLTIATFFVFFVVAMSMFEVAVHFDWNRLFAPRSYARPIQVSVLR